MKLGNDNYRRAKRAVGIGLSSVGLALGALCFGQAAYSGFKSGFKSGFRSSSNSTATESAERRLVERKTAIAGLLLGIPVTFGALGILKDLRRDRTLMGSRHLQILFYRALQANQGKITPGQLALLGQLSVADARECLDSWAESLPADLELDETGGIVYCFKLS